jgi:geranylgeranyl diphosphate synthase type I
LALLDNYKKQINSHLVDFFADPSYPLQSDLSDYSQEAFKLLRQYTMRPGKRIRGSLAAMAYDDVMATVYAPAGLRLGVALELLQSYLLIIDDVMDKSLARRGDPTLHQAYKRQHLSKNIEHEANMLAVNVGLIAQHLSNRVLADSNLPPKRILHAMYIMHTNMVTTGFGQIDDMHQQFMSDTTDSDIIRKYSYKCSYYTFINPLQCALALAGKATEKNLASVQAFGEPAGIAFQLKDDIMAIFGSKAYPGATSIDDIREGKRTLLVQYALHYGGDKHVAELKALLGAKHVADDALPIVQNIFDNTGAKKYVEQLIQQYSQVALAELEGQTTWSNDFAVLLRAIVGYSTDSKPYRR